MRFECGRDDPRFVDLDFPRVEVAYVKSLMRFGNPMAAELKSPKKK
jgi:hypothetical protein